MQLKKHLLCQTLSSLDVKKNNDRELNQGLQMVFLAPS